jgi:hypothetical protein
MAIMLTASVLALKTGNPTTAACLSGMNTLMAEWRMRDRSPGVRDSKGRSALQALGDLGE